MGKEGCIYFFLPLVQKFLGGCDICGVGQYGSEGGPPSQMRVIEGVLD